jgi:hypothetical protein
LCIACNLFLDEVQEREALIEAAAILQKISVGSWHGDGGRAEPT